MDKELRSEIVDKTTIPIKYYDYWGVEQGVESVIGLKGIRDLLHREWNKGNKKFSFGTGISSYKLNGHITYVRITPRSTAENGNTLFNYITSYPPLIVVYTDNEKTGYIYASLVSLQLNGTNDDAANLLEGNATFSTTIRAMNYDTGDEASKSVDSFDGIRQAIFDYLDMGYERFKIDNFTMNGKTISFTNGSSLTVNDGWMTGFKYYGSEYYGSIGIIDVTST